MKVPLLQVDSTLGRLIQEERDRREELEREVKGKREYLRRVEDGLNGWEGEIRVRERELILKEERVDKLEREYEEKVKEMREDQEREWQVSD